ncbi:hypothetical protein ATANTOWER_028708, partial [Ataeniobius toweri]|nr:hypothetical protein [Ataeniobius toweri]
IGINPHSMMAGRKERWKGLQLLIIFILLSLTEEFGNVEMFSGIEKARAFLKVGAGTLKVSRADLRNKPVKA